MTTEKQITANQKNALKGGVKTEEGKEISRYNSVQHGIFLKSLNDEEKPVFTERLERLVNEMNPETEIEELLIKRLAFLMIRLDRIAQAEFRELEDEIKAIYNDAWRSLEHYTRYEKRGSYEIYQKYETNLENRIYRLLNQYERMKRLRLGEIVPAPVNIDINTE